MLIKDVPISKIFSWSSVLHYISKIVVHMVLVFIIVEVVVDKAMEQEKVHNQNKLSIIHADRNKYGYDEKMSDAMTCLVLRCKYIVKRSGNLPVVVLKNIKGEFISLNPTEQLINNIYKENEHEIVSLREVDYVGTLNSIESLKHNLLVALLILYIIVTLPIHFFLRFVQIYKGETEEMIFKNKLENSLQKEFSESLHHELKPPIGNIQAIIRDIYKKMFTNIELIDYERLDFNKDNIQPYKIHGIYISGNDIDNLIEKYHSMNLSISRIISMLTVMSQSKTIKASNGTISIFDIVDNSVKGINNLLFKKIDPIYLNREILSKYSVGYSMDNGMMLSVVHNLIKNSIEAGASKIYFEGLVRNDKFILIIKDDVEGGIRDKYGKTMTVHEANNVIFESGYTTKNSRGDMIFRTKTWKDTISDLTMRILGLEEKYRSERGVGLCLNRKLLLYAGGNIRVIKTDANGTDFEVSIPYKLTKKDIKNI